MQLHQVRKLDSLIIYEYLAKVNSFINNLTIVGDEVAKCELIMYLLGGLGSSYRGFVTSLNMGYAYMCLQ